jgi:hypothetical protein
MVWFTKYIFNDIETPPFPCHETDFPYDHNCFFSDNHHHNKIIQWMFKIESNYRIYLYSCQGNTIWANCLHNWSHYRFPLSVLYSIENIFLCTGHHVLSLDIIRDIVENYL